jgi:hypothetical protein
VRAQKLIQPHRRFIHEGKVVLTKQGVASTLERTLYLFNDILVIAKEEEKESRGGYVLAHCLSGAYDAADELVIAFVHHSRRMMQFKCLSSVSAIVVEPEASDSGCSFRLTCQLTSLNASPQESKLVVTVASPSHVKEWIAKFDEAIGDTKHKWTRTWHTGAIIPSRSSSSSLTSFLSLSQSTWKRSHSGTSAGCGYTVQRRPGAVIWCISLAAPPPPASASVSGRSISVRLILFYFS